MNIFRHRYKIDRVLDEIDPEGRFVVKEKPWWMIFGPYFFIGHAETLTRAKEIVEEYEKRRVASGTIWTN